MFRPINDKRHRIFPLFGLLHYVVLSMTFSCTVLFAVFANDIVFEIPLYGSVIALCSVSILIQIISNIVVNVERLKPNIENETLHDYMRGLISLAFLDLAFNIVIFVFSILLDIYISQVLIVFIMSLINIIYDMCVITHFWTVVPVYENNNSIEKVELL